MTFRLDGCFQRYDILGKDIVPLIKLGRKNEKEIKK
jgi:hypothetical protein